MYYIHIDGLISSNLSSLLDLQNMNISNIKATETPSRSLSWREATGEGDKDENPCR